MDSTALLENGHLRLKHCRYGPMLYLVTDRFIGQSLDRYGEFSEGEVTIFRQIVRPGGTVLDIGANLGTHTVFFAKATGSGGAVYAFEPQRVLFQILCANVALNGLSNVYTYQAAVGRQAGTVTLPRIDYTVANNFGGLMLGNWSAGEATPLLTIDSLNLPACHLIKVDVEGMEAEAIAGAEQTIRRFRPFLYVENDRREKSAALIEQIFALDYRLYWHLPPLFNPQNHFAESENIFGRTVSVNMLCLHKSVRWDVRGLQEIQSPNDDSGCIGH
jgi:FkbM family methyltransferase